MASSNEIKVRAAAARALVIAFINRNTNVEFTAIEIARRLNTSDAPSEGTASPALKEVVAALKTFTRNKMVKVIKRQNTNWYSHLKSQSAAKTPPEHTPPVKDKLTAVPPAVLIDLVKNTGRVRVQLGGMIIEIGIVTE